MFKPIQQGIATMHSAESDDEASVLVPTTNQLPAEQKTAPTQTAPDTDLPLEELKKLANAASIRQLVVKEQRYSVIRAMLAHGLLTRDMLEPLAGQASILAFLIHYQQTPLVLALLDKDLITQQQVADSNRGSNAAAIAAYHGEWALLQRLMTAKLIPAAALFKSGDAKEDNKRVDSALTFIEAKADSQVKTQVDQYLYSTLHTAIDAKDRNTVMKWLDHFIATRSLTQIMPALDYLLQTLPKQDSSFATKMALLHLYLQRATQADQKAKQAAVLRFVKTSNILAKSVTDQDEITAWFRYANHRELLKPIFTVKRMLRSDDMSAWDALLNEVGIIEKFSTPSEAQEASENAKHSLLN